MIAANKLKPESPRDCWRTPRWVVDAAASYCGGPFGLDIAADADNTVAPLFYSLANDALSAGAWSSPNGRTWCNPPFSRLGAFVSRCLAEVEAGHLDAIGLLTLADVSTAYWRALERAHGQDGVVAYRLPIVGRWSCEPPPGVEVSTPTRPMAVWILRRPIVPPRKRVAE